MNGVPTPKLAPLLAVVLCGCGAAQESATHASVTSPFTSQEAQVFEDGMDMIRDPRDLEGPWLQDWQNDLDKRIRWADAVALVTIQTLRTDVDLDRHQTYRLIAHVDQAYLGQNLAHELVLLARQGEGGYGTIENNERRVLDQQFIVFVKWAEEDDEGVRARWHLSPATDQVKSQVRAALTEHREDRIDDGTEARVIIRHN